MCVMTFKTPHNPYVFFWIICILNNSLKDFLGQDFVLQTLNNKKYSKKKIMEAILLAFKIVINILPFCCSVSLF